MNQITILPQRYEDAELILEAELKGPRGVRLIRFQIPRKISLKYEITKRADPFILAFCFHLMSDGMPVKINGSVSAALLRNLEEYMQMWQAWLPDKYRAVRIEAEEEIIDEFFFKEKPAILCFSGGVDSCYSAWRHHRGLAGRSNLPLTAGLFVHGADIPLNQPEVYNRIFVRNKKIMDSLGMDLICIRTDARRLKDDWEDAHASILAGGMMLFESFSYGLLASSMPLQWFGIRWGSTPWTDHLLSSGSFRIVSDGFDCSRTEKIERMSAWPELRRYLHVCWAKPDSEANCCKCEKCTRTILAFLASGSDQPPCFPQIILPSDVINLHLSNNLLVQALDVVYERANKNGHTKKPIFKALRRLLRRHHRREWIRNRFILN